MSSSAPKLFITGISGYIGGHLVASITEQHPDWQLTCLVRDESQKKIVLEKFGDVNVVVGDLDNRALLLTEGAKADIVIQAASADHIPGVEALIEGAGKRVGGPAHFIHVGGTGILNEIPNGFGQPSPKIYSDITDLAEITSFPAESHVHRDVDIAVLAANKKFGVPTAILCPPLIHGVGKGPIKTRSLQIPFLVDAILKRGRGFQIGEGKNIWDGTHVDDVAAAFIRLAEEALKKDGGKAQWGQEGYYFADGGEFQWGDVATAITRILSQKGLIKSDEVDKISAEDASALHPWATLIWGGNCRSRSERIHKLGWSPKGCDTIGSLEEMVDLEVKTTRKQSQTTTFSK